MSLRVGIAFEDHTLDQYVVRPVVELLLNSSGYQRAQVKVITDPRIKGIEDLKANICSILARYGPIFDAVIFAVDADRPGGDPSKRNRKAGLLKIIAECGAHSDKAVVVAGLQEIEVWALWGSRDSIGAPWKEVRAEQHPKEVYFDRLTTKEDLRAPGKGRTRLIKKSIECGWNSLKQGCDELEELENELLAVLQSS